MSHGMHRRLQSRKTLREMVDRYRAEAAHLSSDLIDLTARNALLQQENDELRGRPRMPSRERIDGPATARRTE